MWWKELSVRTGRMFAVLAVAAGAATVGVVATAAPAQAIGFQCRIVLGDDGATSTVVANLDTNGPTAQSFANVTASSFIRSTSGPCSFQIFNSGNFTGSQVTLGTGVNTRIRAGLDGVSRKDDGGGSTWRVRSVIVVLRAPALCTLRVGHTNGVRMDYYTDANTVPAMNRAYSLSTCGARLHANPNYVAPTFSTAPFPHHEPGISFGFSMRSIDLF